MLRGTSSDSHLPFSAGDAHVPGAASAPIDLRTVLKFHDGRRSVVGATGNIVDKDTKLVFLETHTFTAWREINLGVVRNELLKVDETHLLQGSFYRKGLGKVWKEFPKTDKAQSMWWEGAGGQEDRRWGGESWTFLPFATFTTGFALGFAERPSAKNKSAFYSSSTNANIASIKFFLAPSRRTHPLIFDSDQELEAMRASAHSLRNALLPFSLDMIFHVTTQEAL
ncbi:hypothetical protein V8E53_006023 [Lactarius tabidus]